MPLTNFSGIEDHQSGREVDGAGKVGVFNQAVNGRFAHRQKLDHLPHTHVAAFGKSIVTVNTGFHDCTSREQSVEAVIARNEEERYRSGGKS